MTDTHTRPGPGELLGHVIDPAGTETPIHRIRHGSNFADSATSGKWASSLDRPCGTHGSTLLDDMADVLPGGYTVYPAHAYRYAEVSSS